MSQTPSLSFMSSPGSSLGSVDDSGELEAIVRFLNDYNDEFPILSVNSIYTLVAGTETVHSSQLKSLIYMVSLVPAESKAPLRTALGASCLQYLESAPPADGPYHMARFIPNALSRFYRELFSSIH